MMILLCSGSEIVNTINDMFNISDYNAMKWTIEHNISNKVDEQ